jgi:hypothetical protein
MPFDPLCVMIKCQSEARIWVRRKTKTDGAGANSTSAFLRVVASKSNATGGQETTPTITARPQHRLKVRGIATPSKDG